jgi:hypothetical protein
MSIGGRTRRLLRVHEREITSSAIALLFAVALCLFVLGRGPGSLVWMAGGEQNLKWLPFAGAGVSWLPYNESVNWLPYQRNVGALTTPTPSPSPTPEPSSEPAAGPTPPPSVGNPTPVQSAPPPPPPTPPPAPVVLFADDFSGDSYGSFVPNWRKDSPAWSIVNDGGKTLMGTGTYAVIAANPPVTPSGWSWTNYTVTADVKASNNSQGFVLARYQSQNFFYWCGLDLNGTLTMGQAGRMGQPGWTVLQSAALDHSSGFYTVTFTVNGHNLTCKASNGSNTVTLPPATATEYYNGTVGALTRSTSEYHNFTVVKAG